MNTPLPACDHAWTKEAHTPVTGTPVFRCNKCETSIFTPPKPVNHIELHLVVTSAGVEFVEVVQKEEEEDITVWNM